MTHTARNYGKNTAVIPKPGDKALTHGPGVPWYAILCEGKYKYVRTLIEGEVEELYDVNNDPEELDNLALNPAFQKILATYRANAKAELRRTEAPFLDDLPPVILIFKRDWRFRNIIQSVITDGVPKWISFRTPYTVEVKFVYMAFVKLINGKANR